jgi:CRP-like cAMP-binding protein
MTGRLDSAQNRLLAVLPPADFAVLARHIEKVPLEQDAVLLRAGSKIGHVYFPHGGAVSLMLDMPSGETVATALIGRDGAVGLLSVLGPSRSSVTAVVRVASTAARMPAAQFQAAFNQSAAIRHMVQLHTMALLDQFQHMAACNALHPVEARLARWLLHIQDHIDSNTISLTQEALSQLLGVRRTTVTLVLRKLRKLGAVRSDRRGLIEIDRPLLEDTACECYATMRHGIGRITTPKTAKPLIHTAHVHGTTRPQDPLYRGMPGA